MGDCTLYRGDCREVLPGLSPVDAVVTDPPYGIGVSGYWRGDTERWRTRVATDYGEVDWDEAPPSAEEMARLLEVSQWQVIFGGNYLVGLPPTSCWLIWDKQICGPWQSAECELAWTNLQKPIQKFTYMWSGFRKAHPEKRWHPTQKPVTVMAWCVDQLPGECQVIYDPYMGSGSTGVAAVQRGRGFIGVEREARYFAIACRRIEEAYAQPSLFPVEAPRPVQQRLFEVA